MYPPPASLFRIVPGGIWPSLKSNKTLGEEIVIGVITVSSALLLVAVPLAPVAVTRKVAPLSPTKVAGAEEDDAVAPRLAAPFSQHCDVVPLRPLNPPDA